MPSSEKMQRVSRENLCPVCGKPDWCLVAEDSSAAICQRIQEGSVKRCGDAGWLHILRENGYNRHNGHKSSVNKRQLLKSVSVSRGQLRDFGQLARRYQQQLRTEELDALADSLGVSTQSLERLNVGWDGKAFTFPMFNYFGKIIGIRRRFPNGCKISVKGSKTGLFIPDDLSADDLLLICEGLTDTAAALDLGFAAIGRPSCSSKDNMVLSVVKGREVVIIGDSDDVGKAGAEKLAAKLVLYCPKVRIVYPLGPIKDLRKWLNAGLTSVELGKTISRTNPLKVTTRFKSTRKNYGGKLTKPWMIFK